MMNRSTFQVFFLFSFLGVNLVRCHMELIEPFPIRSKFDPKNKASGNVDWSMTNPLSGSGSDYPCKGYHRDVNLHSTATYNAGGTYTAKLTGSATHGGGSCQLSLSYDNGATFIVIKSMIGGCPLTDSYQFRIPDNAPARDKVLFAWTWFNKLGNREMYMNCAVVDIKGGSGSNRLTGVQIFKANLGSQGTCKTAEGNEPVFPKRGADVVYGGDYSSPPADDSRFNGCSYPGQNDDGGSSQPNVPAPPAPAPNPNPTSKPTERPPPPPTMGPAPAPTPPSTGDSCSEPGKMRCEQGGQAFSVCAAGRFVFMGSVAAGMKCENGNYARA